MAFPSKGFMWFNGGQFVRWSIAGSQWKEDQWSLFILTKERELFSYISSLKLPHKSEDAAVFADLI